MAMHGLLSAVASLVEEHELEDVWASVAAALGLIGCGSEALEHRLSIVVHGLSYSVACGIFLDQGSNLCLLHCQAILYR